MRLNISHKTSYHYDAPVPYGLLQLRLRPKTRPGQDVIQWDITVEGGKRELYYEDEHANTVDLISLTPGQRDIEILCEGIVVVEDVKGIIGKQANYVPLWLFRRSTELTKPGPNVTSLVESLERHDDQLTQLHALSAHILASVPYSTDQSAADLTAEAAISTGHAVCQDHAHIFISAARMMGFPARYVSGYLMIDGQTDQDASHAWAEAHVDALGWVAFDISNGISPDARYVRVATALDYNGAAPISGMRFGDAKEHMQVSLQVAQQ